MLNVCNVDLVLLKELQSLALDISVLNDDGTEVKIMESVDYGETDYRHVIEGDSRNYERNESFDGYQKQEFSEDGELQTIVEEPEDEDFEDSDEDL